MYEWRKEEGQRRTKKKEGNEEGRAGIKDKESKEDREGRGRNEEVKKEFRKAEKEVWIEK